MAAPPVRLSVRPSVRHKNVPYEDRYSSDLAVYTIRYNMDLSFSN